MAPVIGHDAAAQIAEESLSTGRSVREICLDRQLVASAELERLLDLRRQTQPDPSLARLGQGGQHARDRCRSSGVLCPGKTHLDQVLGDLSAEEFQKKG